VGNGVSYKDYSTISLKNNGNNGYLTRLGDTSSTTIDESCSWIISSYNNNIMLQSVYDNKNSPSTYLIYNGVSSSTKSVYESVPNSYWNIVQA